MAITEIWIILWIRLECVFIIRNCIISLHPLIAVHGFWNIIILSNAILSIEFLTLTYLLSNSHCIILWFSGIQLADELGFKESLSTLEQNSKRRSVNGFPVPGSFEPLQSVPQKNNHAVRIYNTISTFVISLKYYYNFRLEIIRRIVFYLTVVVMKCRHRFRYTIII